MENTRFVMPEMLAAPKGSIEVPAEMMQGAQGATLQEAAEDTRERLRRMAPPGTLGLPRLLDKRRCEFGILDEAFARQAVYDRMLLWQVSLGGTNFGDTSLIMPETTQRARQDSSELGIIVSAGLEAMDVLRANGMDLGHIVVIGRNMPLRCCYTWLRGKAQYLLMLHAGDVIASLDLAESLKKRELRLVQREKEGGVSEHLYVDENGKALAPASPWQDPALTSA